MKTTIIQDRCGFLHIFVGSNIKITNYKRKNKYSYNTSKVRFVIDENSDAELFFQSEDACNTFKENLSEIQLDKLNNGYKISTSIDSLYFENTNFI